MGKNVKLTQFVMARRFWFGDHGTYRTSRGPSGDSMAVYHRKTFLKQRLPPSKTTETVSIGLNCVGMMNIQFVIHEEKFTSLKSILVNCERSILSKVTEVPMADRDKSDFRRKSGGSGLPWWPLSNTKPVHIKAHRSFLSPSYKSILLRSEMKSTGEVMGSDKNLEKLYIKLLKQPVCIFRNSEVLFTVADESKAEAAVLAARFRNRLLDLSDKGTADYFEGYGLPVTRVISKQRWNCRWSHQKGVTRGDQYNGQKSAKSHWRRLLLPEAVEHGVPLHLVRHRWCHSSSNGIEVFHESNLAVRRKTAHGEQTITKRMLAPRIYEMTLWCSFKKWPHRDNFCIFECRMMPFS